MGVRGTLTRMVDTMEPTEARRGLNLITARPTPEWLAILGQARLDLLVYDGALCSEAAGPLADAVQRIEGGVDAYRDLEPVELDGALELLRWTAEKCDRRPAYTLRIQVRL